MYIIENCHTFVEVPKRLEGYRDVLELAKLETLKDKDLEKYFIAMLNDRERKASEEYGFRGGLLQGLEQGRNEERTRIAKSMFEKDCSIEYIASIMNMSPEEIRNILKKSN